ncbi:putative Ig domain-containing protein [Pedobacter sp. ISL-68]|uniref:LamG-like jellyroll fold domain-containing protein n=1 Tax=unclassified Pedobacter TaxID=2628915 RepID=UPI001BECB09A|nr:MULTISPECIES: LamG-like jellyroll fold domain-containing protein [unclassified Pedobacter]MBT2564123.1 putative Ig domain-containing protein [Pedobacter sp. ISL-64]MBT2589743.1 putative Ig domain-containing protein [Pedobacter sp. ISL-68]
MKKLLLYQLKLMAKKNLFFFFFAVLTFIGAQKSKAQVQTLVHPGIALNQADLNQLKVNITQEPWLSAYNAFKNDGKSKLSYVMAGPYATVSRAPHLNNNAWINDMVAIRNLTFMYVFTADSAYARKATNMLDSWAVTNTYWGGIENNLDIGDHAQDWGVAAEILRYTFPGWTAANTQHVENYFANILFPTSFVPNPLRDQNKGAIQLKTALAASIFCNDVTRFNQALEVYRMDAGGGMRNSLPNGETGDTGRDDHWGVQATALVWGAEVAWKQRVDMFSELNNRVLAIAELYHKFAFDGDTMTYIPFGGYASYWTNWGIKPGGRPWGMTNIIHNAYNRRKGIPTPQTDRMRAALGGTQGEFLYLKSSDTSTAVSLPPVFYPSEHVQPVSNLTNIDIGNPGLAGSASFNNGIWTLKGAGNSTSNAFSFNFKKISGDAGLVVKIENMSLTTGSSGVMLRESLAPGSRFWDLALGANGGVGRHGQPKAPWWLKIERVNTRIFAYHSQDGVNWTNLSCWYSATGFPAELYLGFYTISNNTSLHNTTTFSNVGYSQSAPAGSPEISSATTATTTIGQPFSYNISASASPTAYSASGLPTGLSLNTATGIISGTPTGLGQSEVTLTATNTIGSGTATLILKVLNNQAPVAIASVVASVINNTQIKLSWPVSATATAYSVKRSLTAGGPYTTIQAAITLNSFTDPAPVPEVNNYYVITAFTGDMESANSNVVFANVPPGIPGRPVVTNQSDRISLLWDAANGASSYKVKRGTVSGGPYTTVATVSTTSYTDTNVTGGNPYFYVLSSVGATKESANSLEAFGSPGANSAIWSPTPLTDSLNLAANWTGNVLPANPAILTFGSTTDSLLTNDLTGLVASRIQFASDANSYTIAGNGLTLKNDLVNNSSGIQTFTTPLQLTDQVSVSTGGGVVLNGAISGTGSLRMNSWGNFYIKGNNSTYSGNTTIISGKVIASGVGTGTPSHPTAGPLGTGKIIMNGGLLQAPPDAGLSLYNDIEVLPGTRSNLYEDYAAINLYGKLTGSGNIAHDGNYYAGLNLYGDNSEFTGTFVSIFRSGAQRIRFMVPESGSAKANWLLDANAPDCQNLSFKTGTIHFGSLSGRGYIRTAGSNSPVISIGALNSNSDYGGTIDALGGNLTVEKVGTGTFRMWGNQLYGGTTTVKKGKLFIANDAASGVFNSPIIVQEGTLGGSGVIQSSATIGTGSGPGAILEPGVSAIGTLKVGALTMKADATYTAEINLGTAESDKVTATSVTLLNSTKLKLIPIAGVLPSGTSYTIVNNTGTNPINGTFKDLPELSLISAGAYKFRITYKGGDGNDVVISDNRSVVTLTATKDSPFNYTLSAGNNPTSFSLTGLPQGLSLNATTGAITGTPTQSGIFMLYAKATGSASTVTIIAELTVKPNAVPPATVLQGRAFSAFQADLSWNTLPASWFVSGYTVKRSETAGGPYVKIAESIKDSVYSDKGLNAETSYYYVLSASNEVGESANSAEVSITMPAPSISPMVRVLVAVGGNAKVSLNWRGAYEALTYNVKRSLTATGPFSTITNQPDTTYTDTGVSNGTKYYYVVTAVNPAGESVPSTVATAAPETATFAYWPFNEAMGSSATDIWNNKQVVLEGTDAGWDKGISGSGLKLGGNSYATLPAGAVSTLTNFTIATWVKLDETKAWERVFDFGTGTTNYMFLTTNVSGGLRFTTKVNGGAEQIMGAPYAMPLAQWVHLAVTLNGTTAVLYANGNEIARNNNYTLKPSMLGNTTQTWIGKSQFADPLLKGMVDDFRIYSRALSAVEIAAMQENKPDGIPEITSATTATGILGRDFEYAITATHSPYSYKASVLPAGLSLNTTTGVISGKPTQAGNFIVNLTASNTNNGTASLNLNIQSNIVSNIRATAGDAQIILQWDSVMNANYSYRIKRSQTPGGPYTTVATIKGSEYFNAGLTNGVTYYYTIATIDGIIENPNSAEISAKPFVSKYSYWPFDEANGITATDVWSSRTGTLKTAATWTAGKINNGLRLDGTANGYATLPTSVVSTLNDFTIATWVKMDGTSNWARIFDFGTGTTNYMFLTPKSSAGNPRYAIKAGGGELILNSSIAIKTGEWTHIAVTQSGSEAIMYINGVEVGRNSAMTLKPSSLGNTTLNYLGKSQWPDPMLNGTLDDFRIYSKALTATEIKMLNAVLSQTITFNALAQKTVGDADFDAGATASSGLTVSYSSSDPNVATIINGQLHILTAGTTTITASQAGNAQYLTATPVSQVLTVKNVQTINFAAIAPKVLGDADFTLEASASSGIPVSFSSSDESVATVINGVARILKAGTTVFTASQPGNETYNSASVTQNLTILPLNLKVLSADGDNGQQSNNVIRPKLKIVNGDTTSTSYSILTARYWLTAENFAGINTWIDYAQMGNSKVKTKYVALPQPRNDAYGYIEYSFDVTAGTLSAGASSGIIESGLANSNWANLTESNDFSYRTGSTYTDNSKITLYRNGTLIWGNEPAPITETKSVKVLTEGKSAGSSTISTYLKLENTGNTPVDYKDISIRYFFTPESAAGLNFWADYANLGASKIQGQFVAINPSLSTNGGAYLELKVDSSAGKLHPLSGTGNIQYRIAKSDWSAFNQLNDHSYQPGSFAENNHVCVYYRGELIYGTVPNGTNSQLAIAAPKESSINIASSIVIYPNPVTNNRFNITTTANLLKKDVEVKLVDLTGRTVYSKSAVNNSGDIEVQLQRQVSAGLYILLLNKQYAGKVLIN